MANGVITWNGVSSDGLGIIVRKVPSLNRPRRKHESHSVPGRNGNIVVMQDAYEEYEQDYEIFMLDDAQTDARTIADWLFQDGYCELKDDWEPNHYRLAYFVGPLNIETILEEAAVCTVTFRRKPQRYLAQGTNVLPKMTAGTYSNNGGTVVVDANGKATLSGSTTTGNVDIAIIPLEYPITITGSMIDNNTYLYLNNYNLHRDTIIFFENDSSVDAFIGYAYNSEYSVMIPPSAFGKTVTRVRVRLANIGTLSGTFNPKLQSESSVISVPDGGTVINPTRHTALPIITLTGSEVVTSMLTLENTYDTSYDNSSPDFNLEWLTDTVFVENYSSSGRMYFYTPRTELATSEGGRITTQQNSTGTLGFTPYTHLGSLMGVGIGITLTPDTDYTFSCNTSSGNSRLWVGFFENGGSQTYNSSAEASRSGAGVLSLTFHVPLTCANTLFIFYRSDNTAGSFSQIMLTSGTEILPFYPYAIGATENFTIGNTTAQFTTTGFNTAVIDCENENFTIDGENANSKATVLDQYGNLSTTFLQLEEGNNVVSYTSDITSASIVPHFWDL